MAYINGKKVFTIVGGSGGGSEITVDSELSTTSINPVQNKVITEALNGKADASALTNKQNKLTAGKNIKINNDVISAESSDTTYIDLEPYTYEATSREALVEAFNAKVLEAYNNRPTGAERANICFYNSGSKQFKLKDDVILQSNCNYSFLDSNFFQGMNFLVLSGIQNCDFYGLNLGSVMEGSTLKISNCSNLQFFNSLIENGMTHAIEIEESTDIYFENCTISGGSYTHIIMKVINTAETLKWAMFENCIFNNASTDGYKVIDASGVTNTKQLVSLMHCFFKDLDEITADDVTKGSAVIKVSALTTL